MKIAFFLQEYSWKTRVIVLVWTLLKCTESFFIWTSIFSSMFSNSSLIKFTKGNKTACWPAWQRSKKGTKSIGKWFCAEQVIFKLYFTIRAKICNEKHMMYTYQRKDWTFLSTKSVATSIGLQEHLYTLDLYLHKGGEKMADPEGKLIHSRWSFY